MEPNIFSSIFSKEVSIYKFINKLVLLFTRETIRSIIALEKVVVKHGFHIFIFKHGYRCALFQFKRKVIQILSSVYEGNVCKELKFIKST